MTVEEAKAFLRDCTEEQKEQFAIIGILASVRLIKAIIDKFRGLS